MKTGDVVQREVRPRLLRSRHLGDLHLATGIAGDQAFEHSISEAHPARVQDVLQRLSGRQAPVLRLQPHDLHDPGVHHAWGDRSEGQIVELGRRNPLAEDRLRISHAPVQSRLPASSQELLGPLSQRGTARVNALGGGWFLCLNRGSDWSVLTSSADSCDSELRSCVHTRVDVASVDACECLPAGPTGRHRSFATIESMFGLLVHGGRL